MPGDHGDEILHRIEVDQRAKTESVRDLLREAGRPDLVAELDANLREVANGRASARGCWSALSDAQREALKLAERYGRIRRRSLRPCEYGGGNGQPGPSRPVRLLTIRKLIRHELLACEGGTFDPEKVLTITERGRFVLAVARLDGPQARDALGE